VRAASPSAFLGSRGARSARRLRAGLGCRGYVVATHPNIATGPPPARRYGRALGAMLFFSLPLGVQGRASRGVGAGRAADRAGMTGASARVHRTSGSCQGWPRKMMM